MNQRPVSTPPAPTRREVVEGLTAELKAAGVESPRVEAERLLALVLAVSRTEMLLHLDAQVDAEDGGRLAAAAARRLFGVPLQHIEGTAAFRELILVCDERALVPRPETEQLVDRVVEWAVERAEAVPGVVLVRRPSAGPPPCEVALDIGTGSGAIALSLVHEGIVEHSVGIDVSAEALAQAAENRGLAGLDDFVDFRLVRQSPWEAIGADDQFDLIVSNPPYVSDDELAGLPTEVRDHEPRSALAGGADGLDVVREIATGARQHMAPGGALFLEVGAGQGEAAAEIVSRTGSWRSVDVHFDLAGWDRFVVAQA